MTYLRHVLAQLHTRLACRRRPAPRPPQADLAAAARAYRHLGWEDVDAISEAFSVLPRVTARQAPALYTALTRALLRSAVSELHATPALAQMNHNMKRLRRQLTSERVNEADARASAHKLVRSSLR